MGADYSDKVTGLWEKLLKTEGTPLSEYVRGVEQPIENEKELNKSLKGWANELSLYSHLTSQHFGPNDIQTVLDSELRVFFDRELIGNLELALQQLTTADQALFSQMGETKWNRERQADAERDWEEYEKEAKALLLKVREGSDDEIADRISAELSDPEAKKEWMHKQIRKDELKKQFDLRERISHEMLGQIRDWLKASLALRQKRIMEYLNERTSVIQKQARAHYTGGLITEDDLTKIIAENERLTRNLNTVLNTSEISTLNAHKDTLVSMLKRANEAIDQQLKELEDAGRRARLTQETLSDPEELGVIENKYESVKERLKAFTPERLKALIKAERSKDPDETGIFHQRRDMLQKLKSIDAGFAELDADFANLKNLPPHQAAEFLERVRQFDDRLKKLTGEKIDQALGLESPTTTQTARELMRELKAVETKEGLKKLLDNPRLAGHLEIVTDSQFENYEGRNLKDYTGGHMVFYERADTWKIIINEEALDDIEAVKQQMTHELQHLEFESNNDLKTQWKKVYGIKPPTEKWSGIKEAFVESFPNKRPPLSQNEPPFAAADWDDDHVLSELYAMQEDLAKNRTFPLARAIAAAGIGESALRVPVIRGFDAPDQGADALLAKAPGPDDEKEPASGLKGADALLNELNKADEKVNVYLSSDYIGYLPGGKQLLSAMTDYNSDTRRLINEYKKSKSQYLESVIKSRIEMVSDDAAEIEKELQKVSVNVPNTSMNPMREIWNRTTFISIEDLVQVGKDAVEWWERRHKRKVADHASKFGMSLFEGLPVPWLGEFGLESAARKEKAEADEVNEWKSRLENKDAWDLLGLVDSIASQIDPNRDQFKAILRVLADKGRIDWRNKSIWTILNKLQKVTYLNPNDPLLLESPIVLRQKLHSAMGEIWDYDEFTELDRKNEGSYESKKSDHMKNIDKIQRQIGSRMEQLLKKKREGKNVEPMEFEALIEYSIINGKFSAEGCMFYLMAGMAEGILTPDRGVVLDKHLNVWPTVEWIVSGAAPTTAAGFKKYCETNFMEEFKAGKIGGVNSRFKNFYWTVAQNEESVIERIRASANKREWDHDWSRAIASAGDAESVRTFMSGRSGEIAVKPTAVENMYVGMTQWFEENAKGDPVEQRDHFARQIASFMMAEGIMTAVAYRKNAIIFRKPEIYGNKARETGMGNHPDWNVGEHRDRIKKFVESMGPLAPFFAMITDKNAAASEDPSEKGEMPNLLNSIKTYLLQTCPELTTVVEPMTNMEDVFNNINTIIKALFAKVENRQFAAAAKATLREGLE